MKDKQEADNKLKELSQEGNSKDKQEKMVKKEIAKLKQQHESLKNQQVNKTTQISKMEIKNETAKKDLEQILQELEEQRKKEPNLHKLLQSLETNLKGEQQILHGKQDHFRANEDLRMKQNSEIQKEVQKLENIAKQIKELFNARE